MPVRKTIEREAADRKAGMTLDEIGAFVAECMREGIPGDTVVGADVTWRSSIKRLKIDQGADAKRRERAA